MFMISKVISIVHRKSSNRKSISLIINIKTNELMKDILSEIIANKRFEVDLQKQAISNRLLAIISDNSHQTTGTSGRIPGTGHHPGKRRPG